MKIQRTIGREARAEGIGLHSGRACSVTIIPAHPNTGIVFRRKGVAMTASHENVSETMFSTNLSAKGITIRTVEHLMASFSGLGIQNVVVDVEGPELPILDGSAREFLRLILEAGIVTQGRPRPYAKILKPVVFGEGGAYVMALPAPRYRISYRLNYSHPLIREEKLDLEINEKTFIREIADARTFGFLKDEEALRARGLAMGASLENAIVLGEDRILNGDGLRFSDEFVRHKMLDVMGDMALLGLPIEGHIVANKSGHRLNVAFVRQLALATDAWDIRTASRAAGHPVKERLPALAQTASL